MKLPNHVIEQLIGCCETELDKIPADEWEQRIKEFEKERGK